VTSSTHSAPTRVLLVTDCLDVYGAERWNVQLLEGLQQRGHRVAIAQPRAFNELTRAIDAMNIRQHWLSPITPDAPLRTFTPQGPASLDHLEASQVLAAEMPDIVVCSDGEPGSNLAMKETVHAAQIPYVIVSHLGFDADAKEHTFPVELLDRLAAVHRNAAAVVGVSSSNIGTLCDRFGLDPRRVHTIANGRPDQFFQPTSPALRRLTRDEWGIDDEHILCCTIARPHPNKRYSVQIEAIQRLAQHPVGRRLRFVWAGDGPGLGRLRLLVRAHGLDEVVRLTGYLSDPTPVLAAADVFVLPSAREGMPLAIIEAMAAGLAIVATDVGGVAEAVGDAAILLPDPTIDQERTVAALHDALIELAADPGLRRTLGDGARTRAGEHLRESTMIDRYESLLTTTVTRTRSPEPTT